MFEHPSFRPRTPASRASEVVDAFFAAAHDGDFEALVAILAPVVGSAEEWAIPDDYEHRMSKMRVS